MKAETMQLQQGTAEWHAHRSKSFNASEAAAMLGLSPYKSRAELLREKATGIVPDVDPNTQARFDRGHEYEAAARELAEEIVGSELYPMVFSAEVDGLPLSASTDGITMLEDVTWEHKTLNQDLAAALDAGRIPEEYEPQMEQGLMLTGAEKCLFMASNGNKETMLYAWYESKPAVRARLLAGWKQFAEDLANYQHVSIPDELI
ncbi:MAG: lambda-exonuclease family protein, partial [Aeromonas veronii]